MTDLLDKAEIELLTRAVALRDQQLADLGRQVDSLIAERDALERQLRTNDLLRRVGTAAKWALARVMEEPPVLDHKGRPLGWVPWCSEDWHDQRRAAQALLDQARLTGLPEDPRDIEDSP